MVTSDYVPERGDLVWIDFDPQAGHEQAGRRPAVVLSRAIYNRRSGLALLCPITRRVKGYPYEVSLPNGLPVTGVILADQVKSLDWKTRHTTFISAAPAELTVEVIAKASTLLETDDPSGAPVHVAEDPVAP